MADNTSEKKEKRPSRLRRILLRTALVALSVLVLVAMGAAAFLFYIQTESGQRWLTARLNSVLASGAAGGIRGHVDAVELSLPSVLKLRGLTLADPDGAWLTVDQASLRMGWSALRRHQLLVRAVRLDKPALLRLPHLPASKTPADEAPVDPREWLRKLEDWPEQLSSLAVHSMDVNALSLGPDVLGEAMVLSLHGSASASAKGLEAGLSLRRDDMPGAEQAEIQAGVTPDAFLTLRLALAENRQGMLARLLPPQLAEEPFLRATLQGAAPLEAWKGDLTLDLMDNSPVRLAGTAPDARTVLSVRGGAEAALLADAPTLKFGLRAATGGASSGLWGMAGQKGGQATMQLKGQASAHPGQFPVFTADGHLTADLTAMQWSQPALAALAGPAASLGADWSVDWRGSGRADSGLELAVRELELTAGALSADGEAGWKLADMDPFSPASRLHAALDLAVADTHGVGAPHFSADGPITAHADVSGSLAALNAALTLDGNGVTVNGEALERPHVRFAATALNVPSLLAAVGGDAAPAETGAASEGELEAGVHARQQDMSLYARWKLLPALGRLNAEIRELALEAAGVRLNGHLAATLPFPERKDSSLSEKLPSPPISPIVPWPAGLALNGEIRADVADWQALNALTGVPVQGDGAGLRVVFAHHASHALQDRGGRQTMDAEWHLDRLSVPGETHAKRQESLSAAAVSGTLHAAYDMDATGGLTLDARNATGRVAAQGVALKSSLATARGSLSGPLSLSLKADGDVQAEAEAAWKPGEVAVQLLRLHLPAALLADVRAENGDNPEPGEACPPVSGTRKKTEETEIPSSLGLRLVKPTTIRYGADGFSTPGLDVELEPSGSIHVQGSLNAQSLRLSGRIDKLRLGPFRFLAPALPDADIEAEVSLTGTPARPGGSLSVHVDRLRVPGSRMPPLSCLVEGTLERAPGGGVLNAGLRVPDADLVSLGADEATATLRLPLLFSAGGLPRPAPTGPLTGQIRWAGRLAPLWNFLPLADRRLIGAGSLHAELAGSLERPRLSGELTVRDATYEDLVLGLLLRDINASVTLGESSASGRATPRPNAGKKTAGPSLPADLGRAVLALSAGDGMGGTLKLDGSVEPATLGLDVRGSMNDLRPLRRQDLRISLSGDAAVSGSASAPDVKADITVNQGELLLADLPGGSIAVLPIGTEDGADRQNAGGAPALTGSLNVGVTVPNRFFVRGHGLDSEWKGHIQVEGSPEEPSVVGTLSAVRGSFDLLNKTFTLARGQISFDGGQPVNPLLDIVMSYKAPNIVADVTVGGTASHPTLALSSQPALPQDEIIAQVMFGQPSGKLGRLETLQLAGAAAALAGFGNGDMGVFDLARKSLGVDVLRVNSSNTAGSGDTGGLGASTLEVGKYVRDNVYVGVSQGMAADSTGVLLQVDLTRHISLEARTDNERTEAGVQWTYDY